MRSSDNVKEPFLVSTDDMEDFSAGNESGHVQWSDNDVNDDLAKWKGGKATARKRQLDERLRNVLKRKRHKSHEGESFPESRPKNPNIPTGKYGEESAVDEKPSEFVNRTQRGIALSSLLYTNSNKLSLLPDYEQVQFSDDERVEELQERPIFPNLKPCAQYKDIELTPTTGAIPAPIAQWLREYQVTGAKFLHRLFVHQKGGILGDDMGLGKTIQVIACLTAAFGKTGDERDAKAMRKMRRSSSKPWYPRVIIVCPGGLMENWKSELQRWGWWHVDIFHGSAEAKESAYSAAKSGRLEILITTYTTYRLNKSLLNTIEWDCVIADECHIIKEKASEITIAMNEINALCRIGLTGTAIQNKYEELWTILNWTNLGRFGSLGAWNSIISEPLKIGQSHDATVYQLAAARKTARKLACNLLPEFFLRRTKALIAHQLPKKSDRVVFCPLTDTQKEAYENFVASNAVEHIRTSSQSCDCGSGKNRGWCCHTHIEARGTKIRWQNTVFSALVTLQKLSNHLALLLPSSVDSQDRQEKDLNTLQIAFPNSWESMYARRDNIVNLAKQEFCGKWKVLKQLLRFWHSSGDKVLVFSHSVRLLKMLRLLFDATASYNVSYLDGSMSYAERTKAVDEFNTSPRQFVFLISTRAGGIGLNITMANKVVIVDPSWNPSYDLQAQDRAYRIGQHRDVEVFRLVSAGTVEEIIYARQIYKQQQANIGYDASIERRYFNGVQENKDKKGEIFGLPNLMSFRGDRLILQDIVNKTNVAESKAGVHIARLKLESALHSNVGGDEDQEDESAEFPSNESSNDPTRPMSQLANLIAEGDELGSANVQDNRGRKLGYEGGSGRVKKHDPIQAILAGAGVEYTHENSEVIGPSKIETHLSRHAEQRGDNPESISEAVFVPSQQRSSSLSQTSLQFTRSDDSQVSAHEDTTPRAQQKGDRVHIVKHSVYSFQSKYHPPTDVKLRQFCSIAEVLGYTEPKEFALAVESWTPVQRRECLERFYNLRRQARK